MAGSSCGVMPMAMASENSSASSSGREKATLMTKIEMVSTAATRTSSLENPRSPTWNAVSACVLRRPTAILPNAVADPVATTTPRPEPWCTTVPMNAHDGRSSGRVRGGRLRVVLSPAIDSPVSTASSHSSWFASISRTSAGTMSPTRSATTSPGTRSRDVDRRCGAVAPHQTSRGGCWRAARRPRASERYSLTKPSPTLNSTIAAMIAPSVVSP